MKSTIELVNDAINTVATTCCDRERRAQILQDHKDMALDVQRVYTALWNRGFDREAGTFLSKIDSASEWAIEFGAEQRQTPCGSTELLGSIEEIIRYFHKVSVQADRVTEIGLELAEELIEQDTQPKDDEDFVHVYQDERKEVFQEFCNGAFAAKVRARQHEGESCFRFRYLF